MSIPNSIPKIAIFVPASAVGGAEHYIKNILYLVEEIGFQPTLILPKNKTVISFFSKLKVKQLTFDIAWLGSADDLEIGTNYLSKLSQQHGEAVEALETITPDVVFVHLPWVDFGLGISLACHNLKVSCINLVHLCPWKVELNSLTKQIFQDLAAANSNFFTVSNDNRIQLSLSTGIELDRIKVFYNSRDIESGYTSLTSRQYKFHRLELLDELELPLKSFLSVSVGRFSHQKNFLDIITSFARIHQNLPDYFHLFLGEGKLKKYYQKIVLDLGLSKKIKFLGYRKDVSRFLALSDLFISTSLYEGLALSILESAQFSCPIIAANSSSAKEIIPSDDYGLLYNPGQYYLLAKHIKFAYFNPQKMGNKAAKLKLLCKEKFSIVRFKENLEKNIKDSLDNKHKIFSQTQTLISYDTNIKMLNINDNLKFSNYQYSKLQDENTKPAVNVNFKLPVQKYGEQILHKNHYKYIHSLHKIAKRFLNIKAILCFRSFNTNFLRSCYLEEEYLLFVISLNQLKFVSFDLHFINRTCWGQDLIPDRLAKFTSYEKIDNLAFTTDINLEKTKQNCFYTSMSLLSSHLAPSTNTQISNLNINLEIIDKLFKPEHYYSLDKNHNSKQTSMKLVR